jgi:hypothetical protein
MSRVGAYGNVLGKWMTQVRASQANNRQDSYRAVFHRRSIQVAPNNSPAIL